MTAPAATRQPVKRRPRPTAAVEQQLLEEVLELKDEVKHLAVAIERHTNAMAQTQMLAARDIASLNEQVAGQDKRIVAIDAWRLVIDGERAEQRGAANSRRSMVAMVASMSALGGGVISALVNWAMRGGH